MSANGQRAGMRRVYAGNFRMGADRAYPGESTCSQSHGQPLWINE
jgi:hypothetical protein